MKRAEARCRPGGRSVDPFALDTRGELRGANAPASCLKRRLDCGAHLVCDHTNLWSILCWKPADAAQQVGDRTALAKERRAKLIKGGNGLSGGDVAERLLLQPSQLDLELGEVHG